MSNEEFIEKVDDAGNSLIESYKKIVDLRGLVAPFTKYWHRSDSKVVNVAQLEFYTTIQRALLHLENIIEDLRDYSYDCKKASNREYNHSDQFVREEVDCIVEAINALEDMRKKLDK